jgi:hypothetical protein
MYNRIKMRLPLVLLGGLALAAMLGCGGPIEPTDTGPPPVAVGEAPPVPPPGERYVTSLGLLRGDRTLGVWASSEEAGRFFPGPENASEFRELPPNFRSPYRARGWEANRVGFGVILYEGFVAAAMYQESNLTLEDVHEIVRPYLESFGDAHRTLSGARVQYWFWQERGHRLMVHYAPNVNGEGRYDLTIAVGADAAMDGIRASYQDALEDLRQVEHLIPPPTYPG